MLDLRRVDSDGQIEGDNTEAGEIECDINGERLGMIGETPNPDDEETFRLKKSGKYRNTPNSKNDKDSGKIVEQSMESSIVTSG